VATIDLRFSSRLAASAGEVWAVASTMDGVNAELRPFVRMTHPAHVQLLTEASIGLGVLPFDRHALRLERVLDGEGFDEESTSWMQRRWRHERRVIDHGDGTCTVTDHLIVVPRLGLLRPVVARVVAFLFTQRHRRLVERFGPA
jgi:ligand-binding SRPBCC domain-containing protein